MKNKSIVKMIIDILMLVFILLEYSKLYTGQLLHEIFGILLFILFVVHNTLNISFYKNLFKGKYNFRRLVLTITDLFFLVCMLFTIVLGIPISDKVFKFLGLNGNMLIRKLHTILGYWGLLILGIHLGLHFKTIFSAFNNKIKNKAIVKLLSYSIEVIIIILGIYAIINTNFVFYLIGKASFAIPTNLFLSIFNNLIIILTISIIIYNLENFLTKKDRRN